MSWRIPPGARQHEHERTQEKERDALPDPMPAAVPPEGACPACGGPYPPTPTHPAAPVVVPFCPPPYAVPVGGPLYPPPDTWRWFTTVTTNTCNLSFS